MIDNANRSGAVVSKPERKRSNLDVTSVRSGHAPSDKKHKKIAQRTKQEKIKVVDGVLTVVTG